MYSIVTVALIVVEIIPLFLQFNVEGLEDEAVLELILNRLLILSIFALPLEIIKFIYTIRVWRGMIYVYGVRKSWLWLCLLSYTQWIPALIWGFSPKYQPEWKVEDIKAEMARMATSGSAKVMDEGLTVNLKERTATEFFQKKTLLRDIHMAIPQGHMVLLLGGSGARKTTFLNAVNGYEKANAEVMLNGSNMYPSTRKCSMRWALCPRAR